ELVDVLGSDDDIVNAARTSYDKGTKRVSNTKGLLRYLMRHKHSGPIEFGEAVFRIRCPLFVARQWFRHRTGSYNEVSLRYSEAVEEYYVPKHEWITTQDRRNRQARTGTEVISSKEICNKFDKDARELLEHYHGYLDQGVAREIARINLPLSLYTTFMYKSDIRNLLNFFSLRTDSHAQFEIRQYANIMVELVEKYFPITIAAWKDYTKNAINFSAPELKIFKEIIETNNIDLISQVESYFSDKENSLSMPKLESQEFMDKIKRIFGKDSSLDYLGKNQIQLKDK
ncbi:MAG: FAD-dependent thymidylate synthase, partial [Promethearchaeota archaeon]